MVNSQKFLKFLEDLEEKGIYYKLNHVRDSILVEIAIPGERWEVEFMSDGTVEVEKFISEGVIRGEESLKELFDSQKEE